MLDIMLVLEKAGNNAHAPKVGIGRRVQDDWFGMSMDEWRQLVAAAKKGHLDWVEECYLRSGFTQHHHPTE